VQAKQAQSQSEIGYTAGHTTENQAEHCRNDPRYKTRFTVVPQEIYLEKHEDKDQPIYAVKLEQYVHSGFVQNRTASP
jgi:hypothetical protein